MYKKIMIIAGILTFMFNGNVFGQEKIATYNSVYLSKLLKFKQVNLTRKEILIITLIASLQTLQVVKHR